MSKIMSKIMARTVIGWPLRMWVAIATYGKYRVYSNYKLRAIAKEQITCLRERLAKLVEQGKVMQGKAKVTQEQADAILAMLESKRKAAIAKVAGVPIVAYHLPLLATISKSFLAVSIQMMMVKHGDRPGVSHSRDDAITDEIELPEGCCMWLIDVEDGWQFLSDATCPQDEQAIIAEQGRLGVVITGAIALCIHTKVLEHHNVDAPGSRFSDATRLPWVCLCSDRPGLGFGSVDLAHAKWGSASCSSYI